MPHRLDRAELGGDRRDGRPGARERIGPLVVTAHAAEHSLLAPAVGYRLEHGGARLLYVPDVLELADPRAALHGLRLYVGDGATYGRAIVRRREGHAFGHATIETQLGWCASQGVRRAVFTHCGSRIVRVEPREIAAMVERLGEERGVAAAVALDGEVVELPERDR